MGSKKKPQGSNGRPHFFKDVYEQMLEDSSLSFWDLLPVQNTLIGRTVSHVIFRTIGVNISQYIKELIGSEAKLNTTLNEIKSPTDLAEVEFLSSWNNIHLSFGTLQLEALSFRSLIVTREYELWLAQTLTKIPISQWDKQKQKFSHLCGHPAYIVAHGIWRDTIRGRKPENPFSWLPKNLTPIEKYVIARTVKGYELESEVAEAADKLKADSKKHGYSVMSHTQRRVTHVFGKPNTQTIDPKGYLEVTMTDEGKTYFEHAAVLWGLWSQSLESVLLEDETLDELYPCMANSLVNGFGTEMYGRLRASFLSEWARKSEDDAEREEDKSELEKAKKEIEDLSRELRLSKEKIEVSNRDLKKQQDKYNSLEGVKDGLGKKNKELEAKLKATEKKLAEALKVKQAVPPAVLIEPVTPVKDIAKKVIELEKAMCKANSRIEDLFTLLSVDGDEDETEEISEVIENLDVLFGEAVKTFKGRLVINGGAKTWQDRVRKWFEDNGVKVRTYGLGDSLSGLRKTDVVVMNVIQNKHKHSVKFMNEVRCIGARLHICNVNNVEQTLRIVFEHPDHILC